MEAERMGLLSGWRGEKGEDRVGEFLLRRAGAGEWVTGDPEKSQVDRA